MTRYVALLRGVNVGGRTLPMADLRALFTDLGYGDAETYIQSGNVVFSGRSVRAAPLEQAIADTFALPATVLLRTAAELVAVLAANPFPANGADPKTLHVTFLAQRPKPAATRALDPDRYAPDTYAVSGREVFVHCPGGYGRTKINNTYFEKHLAIPATTRNWNTVRRLAAMAGA